MRPGNASSIGRLIARELRSGNKMKDAPTTRETADHAGLAALIQDLRNSRTVWDNARARPKEIETQAADTIENLLSEIAALRDEMERSLPSITLDGEHAISDHRRWLARQLLDSRLDDGEAYSIVAHHPAITDIRNTQAERQRDEARAALKTIRDEAVRAAEECGRGIPLSIGFAVSTATVAAEALANQGADQ